MARGRWMMRGGYLATAMALVALLGACGGDNYTTIVTAASEGLVAGWVYRSDGLAAGGVPVSINPPSLTSPGSVSTGVNGRFEVRAPQGAVTVSADGANATLTTRSAAVQSNQTTTLAAMVLVPRAGATVGGNQSPAIAAASLSATNVAPADPVTITATVTDGDTAAGDLKVFAFASAADGSLAAITPLALGESGYTGALTLATAGAYEVFVLAVDSPGSNVNVEHAVGLVTVTAPPA